MIYDTLKLAEQLEHEAGFDAARAKAMARILAENAGGNLATREGLAKIDASLGALEAKIDTKIGALEAKIDAKIDALEAKIDAKIHAKIGALDAKIDGKTSALRGDIRVLYWMNGTTLAGVAALLGIAITIALHIMRLE
ncbi:MAG: hypothetical protein ACYDAE_27370 [Steroidobacteraceae bacterium]